MGASRFSCSRSNPGPQQSWKGTALLPAAEMAKRPGLSCCVVFCFVLISVLLLERPLETGCRWASGSPGPQPAEQCPLARAHHSRTETHQQGRRMKGSHRTCSLTPTDRLPRRTVLTGASPEGNRRFSCLDPAQTTDFLFVFSLCHFQG